MVRRLLRLLAAIAIVGLLGVTVVWLVTNTSAGQARVRQFVLGTVAGQTHGIVAIGELHGNLLTGATLVGVSITDSAGTPFLKADSISARYDIRAFFLKHLAFSDVVVYRPDILAQRLPTGDWNYRVLWPSTPRAPGDTVSGWGAWATLSNVTVVNGHVTVRSPWSPRAGLSTHARDSVLRSALSPSSRLDISSVPGGYVKTVVLERVYARVPLVRWADPAYTEKLVQVSALTMDALPFRPPAARITALTGTFTFNDDSLWWKGAAVKLPQSALTGDGVYGLGSGDMRLAVVTQHANSADFHWLYERLPDGEGSMRVGVVWKGPMQDYMVRGADVRTGQAHLQGDIGVTLTDTMFFHDADVHFTGLTTRLIEETDSTMKFPRQGTLAGRAKFSGTPKWMKVDSDITFAADGRGTSRVLADGRVGFNGKPVVVSANDLRVKVDPLQIDIVKLLFPTLPVEGTLSGTATLNGSGATQLIATAVNIVHADGPNVTHATGRASFHTLARQTMDLDVDASPLALGEITRFAPTMKLKGLAYGPVHAHGPIDSSVVDARLALPGSGIFGLRGTVDFLSKDLGYDVVADATALDLSRVMINGTATSLNGVGRMSGRGFKTPTMTAAVALDLGASSLDTISVDSVSLRAHLASGLANIEHGAVQGAGARLDVSGQIGLDSTFSGVLTYTIKLDSLATFARFIPGATQADTGVVKPRPLVAFEELRRARADSARIARETEVARAVQGAPAVRLRVPTDTPKAIPRGLLAGKLQGGGTITGSVDRLTLEGTASATGLVVRGNAARHLDAAYAWADAPTKTSRMSAKVRADSLTVYGFAFDSLTADLAYADTSGYVAVRVRQGAQVDYSLKGDFTHDTPRSEFRLANIELRFDSTTWAATHPASIRFGASGVEVMNLELRNGPTRRIYANGLLPTKGEAHFDFEVTDFAVENVAQLLQSDVPLVGSLTLDAHVTGSAEDPGVKGKVDFVKGKYNGTTVPEVHGTFDYANRKLTTNAAAVDSLGKILASVNGTIPVDLALTGVTGSRLLDLPIAVALTSDSLPLALVGQFTTAVSDVGGKAVGKMTIAGTVKKPVLNGNIALSEAQFKLVATGAQFEHLNGSVRMTGDTVYVDSIAGASGGPVRLSGTVAVGDWRVPVLDLTHTAQDATFLKNEQGEVHADVNVHVVGPITSPDVTGRVTVLHGVLYIPEATGKKIIGSDDPTLFNVIDTSITMQRDLFPAQSAMFKNLRMDVDFGVERGTWIRSRDANVEIFTDDPMHVAVLGDALTLTGAVNADRGEYTFLSKRFQIKRGSAVFIGTPDLNPTLQITAEYQVKQSVATNIRVVIGGTLTQPRISLESDAQPPLSQSDLLSYLAFGGASGSLLQFGQTSIAGQQGGNLINLAGTRLAGIALGVALDELEGNAARSLGVDVFNVTPGDIPASSAQGGLDTFLKGTQIEAGRYLTTQTFVSLIATPGSFACVKGSSANSSCAPVGASVTRRTAKGYRFEASYSPRYILEPPTLAGQTAHSNGQFGLFFIREWRF